MVKKKGFVSDNRGFTLMEFVIVVAIMALLVGIMAPQFMKYVEKSRLASDRDVMEQIFKSCNYEYLMSDYTPGQLSARYFNGIGSGGELPASGVAILHMDRNGYVSLNYSNNFSPNEYLYESLESAGMDVNTLRAGNPVRLFKSSAVRQLAGSSGCDLMMRFDTRQVLCMWIGSPAASDGTLSDSCVPDSDFIFGDYEYH